jgi:outer membrane protein/adhesin transport system outer membrane protein
MQKVFTMKYWLLTGVAVLAFSMPIMAQAQSLTDALSMAYDTNPALQSSRAALRSVDENVAQARGGYLPTLNANGEIDRSKVDQKPGGSETIVPKTASIDLTQPLYRGGRTVAGISAAKNRVEAQRQSLIETEQEVLLNTATAYFNVVRDQAVVDLTLNNEKVLEKQLQASNDRFGVGEITKTDVSQSQARLARAKADRTAAEGNLSVTRSAFERQVGQMPELLVQPELNYILPDSLEAALSLAHKQNPNLISSQFVEKAAIDDIDSEFGRLLPEVSLVASTSRSKDPSIFTDSLDRQEIGARLRVPLYQAGVTHSQVRQAKQDAARRKNQVDDAYRASTDATIQAWESMQSTKASIESRKVAVSAAEVALDGVRQESVVGSRTTLDVLDAEQELLDAKVTLIRSIRDQSVATFQLMAAIGKLTAKDLSLPVKLYDVEVNYEKVSDKLWGTSVE